MNAGRAVLAAALLVSCRPAPRTETTTASTPPAAPAPMVRLREAERFFPASGESAIRAFEPDVQPVESAGECRLMRTGGSGATIVTASFPSFDSARTTVSLTFDSVGNLVRFSDIRGVVRYRTSRSMSDAQRDSVARAADAEARSTSISLDYAADRAIAANRGGGRPTQAVIGPVRSLERLERLGPPTARLARVRKLCGV